MANTNNNNKAYQEALKQIDDMVKKQDALKKSTDSLSNSWSAIASEIFKMDGAQFFKNVTKSQDELEQMGEQVVELTDKYTDLGNEFEKMITKSIGGVNGLQSELTGLGNNYKIHLREIPKHFFH